MCEKWMPFLRNVKQSSCSQYSVSQQTKSDQKMALSGYHIPEMYALHCKTQYQDLNILFAKNLEIIYNKTELWFVKIQRQCSL